MTLTTDRLKYCCDAVASGEARDRSTSATGRNQSRFLVFTWQICLDSGSVVDGGESAASSVLPGPPIPRPSLGGWKWSIRPSNSVPHKP
jgi:hypothetical protein